MPEAVAASRSEKLHSSGPTPGRLNRKILLVCAPALLLATAGGSWFFVPQVKALVASFSKPSSTAPQRQFAGKPVFVSLPEMTVTLPNAGQPRQLRITLSLELSTKSGVPSTELLSPRVYDAILTYLRTLHDNELQGSLAIDQIRGDLYRRLSLLLPPGTLRDVLITGLIVG